MHQHLCLLGRETGALWPQKMKNAVFVRTKTKLSPISLLCGMLCILVRSLSVSLRANNQNLMKF